MTREEEFSAKLNELTKKARNQKGIVSNEQIDDAFSFMELTDDNRKLIEGYLKSHGIGIGAAPDPSEYLSEKEHNYLEDYLESISQLPTVTDAEKEGITISAMSGDKSAQNRLIEIYLPLVPDIARMYVEQGVYLEDLIGEGNIALTKGVTMLKAIEKPMEAESFLTKLMMDAMEDIIADSLDEDARGQKAVKLVQEVADKAKELANDLRRKVTVYELADESGMDVSKIIEAVRMSGNNIEDIDFEE